MKNFPKKRFLVCFRPVVDMDLMLESKTVVADRVRSKEEIVKPSDMENSIVIHHPGKKTFSQVIKAVVFEIILAKSVRGRKVIDHSAKHDFRLSRPLVGREIQKTISNPNSIPSCSSSSSSSQNSMQQSKAQELQNSKTSSCEESTEMNPRPQQTDRSSSSDSAIFLLLVSLALTIFWGKFFAILFTSIWLYFLPQYQKPTATVIGKLESINRSLEKKSENCKKKVIMEGLLERNQLTTQRH